MVTITLTYCPLDNSPLLAGMDETYIPMTEITVPDDATIGNYTMSSINAIDIDRVNDETSVDIPTSPNTMDVETVGDAEMGVRCLKALGVFPKEWEDWSN